MPISDQLKRAFLTLATAICCSCLLFLALYVQWTRVGEARNWAHEVVKVVFECNILGSEYLTLNNLRAKEQYRVSSTQLGTLLANPPQTLQSENYAKKIAAH